MSDKLKSVATTQWGKIGQLLNSIGLSAKDKLEDTYFFSEEEKKGCKNINMKLC